MKTNNSFKAGKVFAFCILIATLLANTTALSAQKPNFSGNWTFNEGKSQLGENRFRMPASKLSITQDETTLSIERTSTNMDGEQVVLKEKYTLDGKESENAGMMNTTKKSTVTWSADNKTLSINSISVFERDGNSMEIKTVEALNLSDDAKTLTITSTSSSSRGERKQIIVYTKSN